MASPSCRNSRPYLRLNDHQDLMVQKLLPKNFHQIVNFFSAFQVYVILLKSQQKARLDPWRIHLPSPTEEEQELTAFCAEVDFSCCHCDMKAFGLSSPPRQGCSTDWESCHHPQLHPSATHYSGIHMDHFLEVIYSALAKLIYSLFCTVVPSK